MNQPSGPDPDAEPTAAESFNDDDEAAGRARTDPVGVVAVVVGFVGIVVFGIALAIVAAILGGLAGQRAKEQGRSLDLAYLALGLAAIDGLVWITFQILFAVPITIG